MWSSFLSRNATTFSQTYPTGLWEFSDGLMRVVPSPTPCHAKAMSWTDKECRALTWLPHKGWLNHPHDQNGDASKRP